MIKIPLYLFVLFAYYTQCYGKPACSTQLYKGAMPNATNAAKYLITPLCKHGFTVGYSHTYKTPVWSAEHLTTLRLEQADQLERVDHFHEEPTLPNSSKITIKAMKAYGYDRGHLAPHHDMHTLNAQFDSFSLANIVLQNRHHNRKVWSHIERQTRYLVYKYGEAYVVTGISLNDFSLSDKGVIIPKYMYKAIFIPSLKQAGVFWSINTDNATVQEISLIELKNKIGFDVFPSLQNSIKNDIVTLGNGTSQTETVSNNNNKNNSISSHSFFSSLKRFFVELITLVKKLFL